MGCVALRWITRFTCLCLRSDRQSIQPCIFKHPTSDAILPHGTARVKGDVLGFIERINGTVRKGLRFDNLVAPGLTFVVAEIDSTALALGDVVSPLGFGQAEAIGNRKEQTLAAPGKCAVAEHAADIDEKGPRPLLRTENSFPTTVRSYCNSVMCSIRYRRISSTLN